MPYTRTNWTNLIPPPISATNLDKIEAGIDYATPFYNVRAYGAIGDGITDDSAAFQAAINACSDDSTLIADGSFRLNNTVNLDSKITYDFRSAVFYPGAGMAGAWMFYALSKSEMTILEGKFLKAAFSPTTTVGTGTYINGSAIHLVQCSDIHIFDSHFEEWWGSVNLYNCSDAEVLYTYSYNGNAAIAAITTASGPASRNIKINYNTVIGCGDDGVAVGPQASNYDLEDIEIIGNYIDKTRLDNSIGAAVGIRVGRYGGGTGVVKSVTIADNQLIDMVEEAILVHDLQYASIIDNIIDGYAKRSASAILAGGSDPQTLADAVIRGNIIKGGVLAPNSQGLWSAGLLNSIIEGNIIYAASTAGFGAIDLTDSSDNIIKGNRVIQATANSPTIRTWGTSTGQIISLNDLTVVGAAVPIVLVGSNSCFDLDELSKILISASAMHEVIGTPSRTGVASWAAWAFNDNLTELVGYFLPAPKTVSSGLITVKIHWTNATADAGDVRWNVILSDIADGAALSVLDFDVTANITAPANDVLMVSTMAGSFSYTVGRSLGVRVGRFGAEGGDTKTGDAELLAVELIFS